MAPSHTRSHSPPLPPNASYSHPSVSLKILPSSISFVAGSKLTGILEVCCKDQKKVALGQLAIEFVGVEELKLRDLSAQASVHGPHKCLFQGPSLPPSNAVATSEAPIAGHYYPALRGRTKFPFSFPLPSKLPSSTIFENLAIVSYTLKATCQVLSITSKQNMLLTSTRPIRIIAPRPDWSTDALLHEPVEARAEIRAASNGSVGVWAELRTDKRLHWNHLPAPNPGLIHATLCMKNNSRRLLSSGVVVKLCRRLIVSQDPHIKDYPIQVVCTKTLRGPEYEFPPVPGQGKTIDVTCALPAIAEPTTNTSLDDEAECFTATGMTLFSVQVFLRVELELGALSENLVIELPLDVVHPSSLPHSARSTIAHPPAIDHVRSPDPLAVPSFRPRSGSIISDRPSSPHPVSLQPGRGAGSRCASPQPEYWPGPSPVPSPRFSPLPTPSPSPLPLTRFSQPFHYEMGPACELAPTGEITKPGPASCSSNWPQHPPSDTRTYPYSPSHAPSWPQHQHPPPPRHLTTICPDPGPSYNAPQPTLSSVSPTPWNHHRRPGSYPNEAATPFPVSQPYVFPQATIDLSSRSQRHQSLPSIPPPSLQSGFTRIPCPGNNYADDSQIAHQSFSPEDAGLELFRRTSMPLTVISQGRVSTGSSSKRALPTPPSSSTASAHCSIPSSRGRVPHSRDDNGARSPRGSNGSQESRDMPFPSLQSDEQEPMESLWNNIPSDHHYEEQQIQQRQATPSGSRPPPSDCNWACNSLSHGNGVDLDRVSEGLMDLVSRAAFEDDPTEATTGVSPTARLETIGEAGESRIGTMKATQVPKSLLATLCDETDPPFPEAISHIRGTKPRKSDGSDSVQTLEELVEAQDQLRYHELIADHQPKAAMTSESYSDGRERDLSISQGEDADLPPSPLSATLPPPATTTPQHAKATLTQSQTAGLAQLAGLLNLTQMSGSSTQPQRGHPKHNLSVGSVDQQASERPTTPSHTGTAGALRARSSAIAFDHAFVDAVPPPSKNRSQSVAIQNRRRQERTASSWVPPSTLASSVAARARTIDGDEDPLKYLIEREEGDEAKNRLARQPAVAPDALFPSFHHQHEQRFRKFSLPARQAQPIFTPRSPFIVKKKSVNGKRNTSVCQRQKSQSTPPLEIVASSMVAEGVEENIKPKASASHKVAKWLMEGGSEEAKLVKALEESSANRRGSEMSKRRKKSSKCSALGIQLGSDDSTNDNDIPAFAGQAIATVPSVVSSPRPLTAQPSVERVSQTPLPLNSSPSRPLLPLARPEGVSQMLSSSSPSGFSLIKSFPSQATSIPVFAPLTRQVSPVIISPSNTPQVKAPVALRPPISQIITPKESDKSSGGGDSDLLTTRRPLPATPDSASPTVSSDTTVQVQSPVRALFSERHQVGLPARSLFADARPKAHQSLNLIPFPTSSMLEAPPSLPNQNKSPSCSPTTLSRKSRTRRQQLCSLELKTTATKGDQEENEAGELEMQGVAEFLGLKDPIHQSLIEAMEETNAAVAKATSKRLSTPVFSSSMSMLHLRPSPLRRGSVPKRRSVAEDRLVEDRDASQSTEAKVQDEGLRVHLRSPEAPTVRGGSGGRVSSAAAQWARGEDRGPPLSCTNSTRALSVMDRDCGLMKSPSIIRTGAETHRRTITCSDGSEDSSSCSRSRSSSSGPLGLNLAKKKPGRITDLIKHWEVK